MADIDDSLFEEMSCMKLRKFSLGYQASIGSCIPLGPLDPSKAALPLVSVTVNSRKSVYEAVRKSGCLKTSESFKNMRIPFDLTPRQNKYYNNLKKEEYLKYCL